MAVRILLIQDTHIYIYRIILTCEVGIALVSNNYCRTRIKTRTHRVLLDQPRSNEQLRLRTNADVVVERANKAMRRVARMRKVAPSLF